MILWTIPLLFSPGLSAAVQATPTFLFPSGPDYSTTFTLGQAITITWSGAESFTSLSLGLRSTRSSNISWLIGNPESSTTSNYAGTLYPWTVALPQTPVFALNESEPYGTSFDFWLVDGGYITQIESTHFNITESSPVATPTTTTSSTPTSTNGTSIPQQDRPELTSVISTSAKIGIGIGAPIAFILAIAGCWWCIRRRHIRDEGNYDGPFADVGDIDLFANIEPQMYGMEVKSELPVPEDLQLLRQGRTELPTDSVHSPDETVGAVVDRDDSLSSNKGDEDMLLDGSTESKQQTNGTEQAALTAELA